MMNSIGQESFSIATQSSKLCKKMHHGVGKFSHDGALGYVKRSFEA